MDRIAQAAAAERAELFRRSAAVLDPVRLPAIIEKDLWVCWSLHRLYEVLRFRPQLIFKGGTSLSKAYNAVERFSEDVDLSLSRRDLGFAESGLAKLLFPDANEPIPEEDLEWMVRLALECRRRVKEQQKRIVPAEFRNTHFSYTLGHDGVEKFVVTTELQSENEIGSDPLPPGQIWTISAGTVDESPGLFRIEVTQGPGSGVKILNRPQPPAFVESVRYGEQNLYTRARELVGDRDPREHEFSVQLRAFDAPRGGAGVGLGVLLGLCGALLQKSIKGGLVVTGSLNLGGSFDPLHNAVEVAELAIDKGAETLLMPVSARKQLFNLPDDLATKINIQFYSDSKEALVKALAD